MKRLILLLLIYLSIILGIFTGFGFEDIIVLGLILTVFFFGTWGVLSSDLFANSKILKTFSYAMYVVICVSIIQVLDQLILGTKMLLNRIFDIFNNTYHRDFHYFWNISEKSSTSYMIIVLTLGLFLYSGLLILNRRHYKRIVAITMPVMIALMIFAPQPIHGYIFLYIASIIAYYYLEKNKPKFAAIQFICILLVTILYSVYPSTEVFGEHMTNFRQGIIVLFEYVDKTAIGEHTPTTQDIGTLTQEAQKKTDNDEQDYVYLSSGNNDLYLRAFVGSTYKNGTWKDDTASLNLAPYSEAGAEGYLTYFDQLLNGQVKYHKRTLKFSFEEEETKDEKDSLYPYYSLWQDEENGTITYLSFSNYKKLINVSPYVGNKNKKYAKISKKFRNDIITTIWDMDLDDDLTMSKKINRIVSYLNDTFTYSKEYTVPDGEDPVLYFFNSSERGSYKEFASAATILLRANGIPARYVEGYYLDQNSLQDASMSGGYLKVSLTDSKYTAWTEVYIDKIGWIPIEVVPDSNALVAASDARQIEIPGIPKITITLPQLLTYIVRSILVILLLLIMRFITIYIIQDNRKLHMTNNQKIMWYGHVWERYRTYTESFFEVDHLIEQARFGGKELDEYDVQIVYEAAASARDAYRRMIPLPLALFDLLIMCRDIL